MADEQIVNSGMVIDAQAAGTTVLPGEFVYHDGTDWNLADASSDATPAQAIALTRSVIDNATATSRISLTRQAELFDSDAPYTINQKQYLSGTAGTLTATRPTTDDDMAEVVGIAITTSQVLLDVPSQTEIDIPVYRLGPGGGGTADTEFDVGGSDNWVGTLLDANDEQDKWGMRLPSNFFSIAIAEWLFGHDTALTPLLNYSGIGAHSAEDSDVSTAQTIAAAEVTGSADGLEIDDISSLFASAGGAEADAWYAVKVDKGSDTDATVSFAVNVRANVY